MALAPCHCHRRNDRPDALILLLCERHEVIAASKRRGEGVSGAGAEVPLDDRRVRRRPPLVLQRLEPSQLPGGKVDSHRSLSFPDKQYFRSGRTNYLSSSSLSLVTLGLFRRCHVSLRRFSRQQGSKTAHLHPRRRPSQSPLWRSCFWHYSRRRAFLGP